MGTLKTAIRTGVPLYWASINMRAGMVVVAPIIMLIGRDFGLSTMQLAWLTSLPVLTFAFASPMTTWMRRFGTVNQIITWALWVLGIGLIGRALGGELSLFGFTIFVGVGIATLNVMLPIWVKRHGAEYSGLLTGIYVTAMGLTTSVATGSAAYLAHWTHWGWRMALLPWGIIAVASAIWWQFYIRNDEPEPPVTKDDVNIRMFMHSKLAWQVAGVFGLQSMNAYATRAWMPEIMVSKGFSMQAAGLTVAIGGLAGSLLAMAVPHLAHKSKDQRGSVWIISILSFVSFLGLIYTHGNLIYLWVFISNICGWTIYPLVLLLIILRSPDHIQAQSLSAMAQTFGYVLGATAPLMAGALFDYFGNWTAAIWMMVGITVAQGLTGHQAGKVAFVQKRNT